MIKVFTDSFSTLYKPPTIPINPIQPSYQKKREQLRRWDFIQQARKSGKWKENHPLPNNLNKRLGTQRKKVGLKNFTYHDLRRSCITNWAKELPAHVVQKLAGHSDIKTTKKVLSVGSGKRF